MILSALVILGSPLPSCDCFVVVKEAVEGLLHGRNPYSMVFTTVYEGVDLDYYSYLPASFLFTLPFRVFLFDVRWASVFSLIISALLLNKYVVNNERLSKYLFILILFSPRSFFIIEHMYLEPIIFMFFVLFLVFLKQEKRIFSALSLATALNFKIHLWVFVFPIFIFLKTKKYQVFDFFFKTAIFIVLLLFPFILWDWRSFSKDIFFFIPGYSEVPSSTPIEKSLSTASILRFLGFYEYKIISGIIFFVLYLFSIFYQKKKGLDISDYFAIVGLFLQFFLFLSFFNHYYLVYLFGVLALFNQLASLDLKKNRNL